MFVANGNRMWSQVLMSCVAIGIILVEISSYLIKSPRIVSTQLPGRLLMLSAVARCLVFRGTPCVARNKALLRLTSTRGCPPSTDNYSRA